MSKGIENLRDRYQQVRQAAQNSRMKDVKYQKLGKYKDEANREITTMTQNNNFQNLEEATFYLEKFTQLQKAMLNASKNKIPMKDFTNQAKEILKEKNYASRNSYLSQPPMDPRMSTQPRGQSGILQSFFQEKKSKLVPQVGFKSLLQNPPVSPRTFKKRIVTNNAEIDRLRAENIQLRKQLQTGGRMGGGQHLQIQIRKQQEKIRMLQNQNEKLLRQNTKLSQRGGGTVITVSNQNYDDYLYSPYVLNPRQNDLAKISMRGSDIDTLSNYTRNYNTGGQIVHYQNDMMDSPSFNGKSHFGAMSEFGDIQRQKDRYSIFQMSKSRYSEYGDGNDQGFNLTGIEDNKTANRNKTAFFKNSGMIVRDQDIQIAFKRTQSSDLRSNRIILYLNNKIAHERNVRITYQYESNYYDFFVPQKFTRLQSLRQARQVIEIRLKNHAVDINSVIEATIEVDGKSYIIWLPIMFIKFKRTKNERIQPIQTIKKIVTPSRLFANEQETSKIIENLSITGRGEAYLWGESAIHEGPIKLAWKQGNKLQVTTSRKWVDMVTFLMFDFR